MLSPFFIEGIRIDPPLAIAPMAGYTDLAYRRIVKEIGGAGLGCTELVSCHALLHAGHKTHILIATTPDEYPLALQIFGGDPELMAASASLLEDWGADIIDINMGCPVPKVISSGGGAVLMQDPQRAEEIVRACSAAVNIPVTVKIRAGWDASSINAPSFAKRMVDAGAKAVAIHGRTRAQKYMGKANWDIIRDVVDAVDVPVIGNGDVVDGPSAAVLFQHTGCAGIMIGRAATGAPWLFREIAAYLKDGTELQPPSMEERRAFLWKHFTYLCDLRGEEIACRHIRRIACDYVHGAAGAKEFRRHCVHVASRNEVIEMLTDHFPEVSHDNSFTGKEEHLPSTVSFPVDTNH